MARYPAVVKEYIPEKHQARVEILGYTDGDNKYPLAEIEYPAGDKFNHTEIRILAGDSVWVDFINDDPFYPIITGYRNPETGNVNKWRRFHHENMELASDTDMILRGKSLLLEFQTVKVIGDSEFMNTVTHQDVVTANKHVIANAVISANAGINNMVGGAVSVDGGMIIKNGDVEADGITLKTHVHTEQGDGNDTTVAK